MPETPSESGDWPADAGKEQILDTPVDKRIICLTGIDGCGKSTHLRRVATRLSDGYGLTTTPLSVWEITRTPKYHHHPFLSDRKAVHAYLSLLSAPARALFIFHGLMESLQTATSTQAGFILADGYWYKYAFAEYLGGEPKAWIDSVVARFPLPRLTVLLDLSPESAWKRKTDVTPYECGFQKPSEDNFCRFQHRMAGLFREHAQGHSWKVVDADRPIDDVARDIAQILDNEVIPDGCRQL